MIPFGRVELVAVIAVLSGLALFLYSSDSPTNQVRTQTITSPAPPETKKSVTSVRAELRKETKTTKVLPSFEPSVAPQPKQPVVNLKFIRRNGLIGQSSEWIDPVFQTKEWTKDGDNQFEFVNGTRLTLLVEADRVMSVRLDFPPGLPSPAMHNALDCVLGRSSPSPFYLDELENTTKTMEGRFKHKDKFEVTYAAGRQLKDGKKQMSAWLVFDVVP